MADNKIKIEGDNSGVVSTGSVYIINLYDKNSESFLKKPEQNNVSDILIKSGENIVTQRELKLRTESMAFMLLITFCIFAFIYPYWWSDSNIYPLVLSSSWGVAGGSLTLMFVILMNRKVVESMILKNIQRSQRLRLLKELI